MSTIKLTADKLAEIASEYFKDLFTSMDFAVQTVPVDVLRFTGSVANRKIFHSFILLEWVKSFDEGIEYNELEM
ncbi:hypothetical protein [Mucilaginibacter aquariorum]|uniref:Nuclear transport factor 2 family protein n=1 Tax=Mucilaginibacter aquariorum TaxID=2967225 RepID=A0ABT1SZY7_9SPHI|nr:hypothetical protein [Mucilaginibacter aquariorum]MCQ6957909.1 hypothetical protein [Mucilaginibacter aquariorum]